MTYLFIADLHLSANHPRLTRGFLALLQHYQHQHTALYILGDWFNAWIGDDNTTPWLEHIVEQLNVFTAANNQVYFQVGNRDFALGDVFLKQFGGQRLPDHISLEIAQQRYRLEHGDALCTDDVSYQRFRKIIRQPLLIAILRKTPLQFRKQLAQGFRKKSSASHQQKKPYIMDVTASAVDDALIGHDVLIHGHTHRPEIHTIGHKKRIVLGDWREDVGEAYILEITESGQQHYFKWTF